MSDLNQITLTQIANLIKTKKISSLEVTKFFIKNIEKAKKLNSFITTCFEKSLNDAKKFDNEKNYHGLLPGIPLAVKDLFCTKNIKTTAGSKILENFVPTYESTVTNNLWKEGAILLGKLNCDEFAMGSTSETSFYGPVKNNINPNFVPGGSKVSSVWARDFIRLGGYWVFNHTVGFTTFYDMYPFEANILWIPDGDNFLVVKGCNGVFKVTKDIAAALLKADDSKNSFIRFSTEGTGSAHLSEIGKETVSSWKKVYANWNPAPNVPPQRAPV